MMGLLFFGLTTFCYNTLSYVYAMYMINYTAV